MVFYNCPRCGYETSRKSNIKNHLLRKNTCQVRFLDIPINDILLKYNMEQYITRSDNESFLTHSDSEIDSKMSQKNCNICKYCKKEFTRKNNMKRHQKKCNKKNNYELDNNELKKQNEFLISKVEEMITKMNMMEEEIKKYRQTNQINNSNSFNTIKNNKIQINNYGCENIDYITDKVFKKLLNTPLSAIPKLIELKHFNPFHPENHNIKITNIHDKFAKIYKDNKWLISHKKDVIQELVDNGYADFEEFKDLNEDEVTNKIKEKYKKMEKYYLQNQEQLYKKSEVSIINGSSKISEINV